MRTALVAAVLLAAALAGCKPLAPDCPYPTVAVWTDYPNSDNPDEGRWDCVTPRT